MEAYKYTGTIDENGHLIPLEPVQLPKGQQVEFVIWVGKAIESVPKPASPQPKQPPHKRHYKIDLLRDLLENAPLTPSDFNPETARWEAMKERYSL